MLNKRLFDIAIQAYLPIHNLIDDIISDSILAAKIWNWYDNHGVQKDSWEEVFAAIECDISLDSFVLYREMSLTEAFSERRYPFIVAQFVLKRTLQFEDPWEVYNDMSSEEINEWGNWIVNFLKQDSGMRDYFFPMLIADIDINLARKVRDLLNNQIHIISNAAEQFLIENEKPIHCNINECDLKLESNQSVAVRKSDKKGEYKNPFELLNELIGLSSVKSDVISLSNFIKMKKIRESKGLVAPIVSYPRIFTGNPGTGKTTVARILASIYKEMGVLKKGHLVETDRSGLVAEYVGQTAIKTNKIIDSALDGVLFIDEAYSLVQGGNGDFGKEAISTLLKRMEDERDRLIVILAGYKNEMQDFINSNPGLKSRFNRFFDFPDYSSEELYKIFCINVLKNQYKLTKDADIYIREVLDKKCNMKEDNFGNARFIRNLFESTIQNQANRLSISDSFTEESITLIEQEDISPYFN